MKNNLLDKSYAFSLEIIGVYQVLISDKHEYNLSRQLLKCGTSIGANVAEANGAISQKDFSAKISIAYKECLETKYWLMLFKDSLFIEKEVFNKLYLKADELAKILYTILKKTRINKAPEN
jgi:four helix bundle protein